MASRISRLCSRDRQLVLLDCQESKSGIIAGLIAIAAPLRSRLKSAEFLSIDLYLELMPDEKPHCTIVLPNIYQGTTNGYLSDITLVKAEGRRKS